jgi:hypothetical protein
MRVTRHSSLWLVLAAFIAFGLAGRLHEPLLEKRRAYHLDLADPLENTSPLVAFTTVALGGFRGVLADALWLRITRLQDEGKYFEIVQLSDWVTKLEPRFGSVWAFHAWNMTYNISVLFSRPEDRWRWVEHGIHLLRNDGLRYNPADARLHWELGWFFQHKLGADLDATHLYYKQTWARLMHGLLGGPRPAYEALTALANGTVKPLEDPEVQDLVAELDALGVPLSSETWIDPASMPDAARDLLARHAAADRLLLYVSARLLKEHYRLDPDWMRQVDDTYGPLDWRLPETHAVYWAALGRRHASGFDLVSLDRMVYQSLAEVVKGGHLDFDPETGRYSAAPNLDALPAAIRAFEEAIAAHPKQHAMPTAFGYFLRDAIGRLTEAGRQDEARALREQYGELLEGLAPPPHADHVH